MERIYSKSKPQPGAALFLGKKKSRYGYIRKKLFLYLVGVQLFMSDFLRPHGL